MSSAHQLNRELRDLLAVRRTARENLEHQELQLKHERQVAERQEIRQVEKDQDDQPTAPQKRARPPEDDDQSETAKKKMKIDPQTAMRSKLMFNRMVDYLKSAQTTESKTARQQEVVKKRVEEKILQDRKHQIQKVLTTLEETVAKSRKEVQDLNDKIEQKENELLIAQLETHYRIMQNYIRTKCDPTIFWMPSIHNDTTLNLQQQTAKDIDAKVRSISRNLNLNLKKTAG